MTEQTPAIDLSVIILTHNTRELTQNCVSSVFADTESSRLCVEIIVVDNASTDDTAQAIHDEFPSVRVIENAENLGFARGNNVGLKAARGCYLLLLNSDTLVQSGALRALVRFMETHVAAGACGPMLLNEDGSLQPSGRPLPTVWSLFVDMTGLYRLRRNDVFAEPGRDYNVAARVGEISGAALLIHHDVYEKVGGFDPKLFAYYEDVDLCKRIGDAGYAIYYVPDAKVIHLWQRSSRQQPELTYRSGQTSVRYYFQKHHGPLAHFAVQAMLTAKEVVRVAVNWVEGNRDAVAFHRRMLRSACAPLP